MKTRVLIITGIVIVVVIIAGVVMINDDPLRYEVESDFLNKIREAGDNSEPMMFTVISKHDSSDHQNYCGYAHMAVEVYWYFADVYNGDLLSSNMTQGISSWCEDGDDSCYCELREVIGVDRRSCEDFFREHVSTTCPVVPMSENATSFDPTKCEWIENDG